MKKSGFFKRLVAVYLSCLLLFFDVLPAVADQSASKAPVKGVGCAAKQDNLSLQQVRDSAEKEAYKDALKSFLVFTKSEFTDLASNDTSLVVNSINTMAVGYIYSRKLIETDKVSKLCIEVTGEVSSDEIKELIELSSGIDRGYEKEYRRQRGQYMEDERSTAKRRNDIEQLLIVKKGDAEKMKSGLDLHHKSIAKKNEECERLQKEYDDLLDMEKRNPGSLNEGARTEKAEKVKRTKVEIDGQSQKLDELAKGLDKINGEILQSKRELKAIDDSLNKKKIDLGSFVFNNPVRIVFSAEVFSDESSSPQNIKKQAETLVQEKARYFASVFMLSRLADLPPSIKIDFPSSSLDSKMSYVQSRIVPSKMEYQDLEGKQSSGAIWIKDAGDYGKAAAMLKAAYVWKNFIPIRVGGAQSMVSVKQGSGGFYMDTTEVTQEAYQRIIGTNPSHFTNCPTCPVERVTWHEADAYCKQVGKRLPTEAEWEYAATSGGREEEYAGTSDRGKLQEYAWYKDNSEKKTHPAGEVIPNDLGLYDMSGNVWEWTDNWSDGAKKFRVLRGGSWNSKTDSLSSTGRFNYAPGKRDDDVGFRCVQSSND